MGEKGWCAHINKVGKKNSRALKDGNGWTFSFTEDFKEKISKKKIKSINNEKVMWIDILTTDVRLDMSW